MNNIGNKNNATENSKCNRNESKACLRIDKNMAAYVPVTISRTHPSWTQ